MKIEITSAIERGNLEEFMENDSIARYLLFWTGFVTMCDLLMPLLIYSFHSMATPELSNYFSVALTITIVGFAIGGTMWVIFHKFHRHKHVMAYAYRKGYKNYLSEVNKKIKLSETGIGFLKEIEKTENRINKLLPVYTVGLILFPIITLCTLYHCSANVDLFLKSAFYFTLLIIIGAVAGIKYMIAVKNPYAYSNKS